MLLCHCFEEKHTQGTLTSVQCPVKTGILTADLKAGLGLYCSYIWKVPCVFSLGAFIGDFQSDQRVFRIIGFIVM